MNTNALFVLNTLSKENASPYMMQSAVNSILKGSSFALSSRSIPLHGYPEVFKQNKTAQYFTTMQFVKFSSPYPSTCDRIREMLDVMMHNTVTINHHLGVHHVLEIHPAVYAILSKDDPELYEELCCTDGETLDLQTYDNDNGDELYVTFRNVDPTDNLESIIDEWLDNDVRRDQKCAVIVEDIDSYVENNSKQLHDLLVKYAAAGHVIVNQNVCFINRGRWKPFSMGYAINLGQLDPTYENQYPVSNEPAYTNKHALDDEFVTYIRLSSRDIGWEDVRSDDPNYIELTWGMQDIQVPKLNIYDSERMNAYNNICNKLYETLGIGIFLIFDDAVDNCQSTVCDRPYQVSYLPQHHYSLEYMDNVIRLNEEKHPETRFCILSPDIPRFVGNDFEALHDMFVKYYKSGRHVFINVTMIE